ncbi:MAG: AAA family ATPase [Planctomycetes bacterium]|nr:AAA family ATPase [Planctomycetota bacterium]
MSQSTPQPAAPEAEAAVLGSMILDHKVIDDVMRVLRGPEDFHKPAHVVLCNAIVALHGLNIPVNMVSLNQHLRDRGQIKQVGGLDYLIMLGESVPSVALAVHHAQIVRKKANRRDALAAIKMLQKQVVDESMDLPEILATGAAGIQDIIQSCAEVTDGSAALNSPVIVRLSDVVREHVRWLWPGVIPRGKVSFIVGDPGLGKSTVTGDITSRTTTGHGWPNQVGHFEPGGVVMMNVEDDPADTIGPRLDAAGADTSRVTILKGVWTKDRRTGKPEISPLTLDRNIDAIEAAVGQTENCMVVIIDPVSACLGDIDSHNNSQVRSVLARLSELAGRTGVAIILVSHLNKGSGPAIHRTTGSVGFVAAARAVYAVGRDPKDPTGKRRLFLPVKNNIAKDLEGLAFELRDAGGVASVAWESEPVHMTAEAMLAQHDRPGPAQEERTDAIGWLRDTLAAGPRLANEVMDEAKNGHDISIGTLRRAKKDLGVESSQPESMGPWYWRLPASPDGQVRTTCAPGHPPQQPAHLEHLAHLTGSVGDSVGDVCPDAQDAQVADGRVGGSP